MGRKDLLPQLWPSSSFWQYRSRSLGAVLPLWKHFHNQHFLIGQVALRGPLVIGWGCRICPEFPRIPVIETQSESQVPLPRSTHRSNSILDGTEINTCLKLLLLAFSLFKNKSARKQKTSITYVTLVCSLYGMPAGWNFSLLCLRPVPDVGNVLALHLLILTQRTIKVEATLSMVGVRKATFTEISDLLAQSLEL